MEAEESGSGRRDFLRTAVAASAAYGGLMVVGARSAQGGAPRIFKAGLIGCGGRGGGVAGNCVDAARALGGCEVRITALADAYADRLQGVRNRLRQAGQEIPDGRCFVGFDGYKRLCATDVDIVLMATAPNFRPLHFAAAVGAGKHVFMEKPVAVDAPGCRRMYEVGQEADRQRLSVVAGTCLRHDPGYAATRKVVAEDGAIGRIVSGAIYYCVGQLWRAERRPAWTDAEYLVRNWVNFCCMSGDHIVEQYVHTLDMLNWHMNAHPTATVGFGGRHRRRTGDQFDFFSNDLEYPGGAHIHGVCRQISGCWGRANSGDLMGERGTCTFGGGAVRDAQGQPIQLPTFNWHRDAYVQEHIVLLESILRGNPVNHTRDVTDSTLSCVMSRIAAYTGQRITWDELINPNSQSRWYNYECRPTAKDFETDVVAAPPDDAVPIPG